MWLIPTTAGYRFSGCRSAAEPIMQEMRMQLKIWLLLLLVVAPGVVDAQSVVYTRHNLSVSGPGEVKSGSETEICLFCHTPHSSRPDSPLWNRQDPGTVYLLYKSPTMQAMPGQPDGSSVLCLSCHDGTIALGKLINSQEIRQFSGGITNMPSGPSNLTTNLRNDHPFSFVYSSALAMADGQLRVPSAILPPVTLEEGKVQCTSCHDPHRNIFPDFLVETNRTSELCNRCHQVAGWNSSSHATSERTWSGAGPDPWPHTFPDMVTVAQNGCENCHQPHNSGSETMLLKSRFEEQNCLDCHNGNVSSRNVAGDFSKMYRHNVSGYSGIHSPAEPAQLMGGMHVECTDCHNPHASSDQASEPPFVPGALAGMKGVSQSGLAVVPAINEYEVCYRCHAGSPGAPAPATPRIIVQSNTLMEFAPSNPSFHPVASPGKSASVPSLIAPLTTGSVMYCTSCHAGDGSTSAAAPHGSVYPHILKLQYLTADGGTTSSGTLESPAAYALCYSCHSRSSILSDNSFSRHSLHLGITVRAPCNTCHDPHGISYTQGNSTNNTALINFRAGVVLPASSGQLKFVARGDGHGACYLKCHGKEHNPLEY